MSDKKFALVIGAEAIWLPPSANGELPAGSKTRHWLSAPNEEGYWRTMTAEFPSSVMAEDLQTSDLMFRENLGAHPVGATVSVTMRDRTEGRRPGTAVWTRPRFPDRDGEFTGQLSGVVAVPRLDETRMKRGKKTVPTEVWDDPHIRVFQVLRVPFSHPKYEVSMTSVFVEVARLPITTEHPVVDIMEAVKVAFGRHSLGDEVTYRVKNGVAHITSAPTPQLRELKAAL